MSKLRRSVPVGLLPRSHDKNGNAKESIQTLVSELQPNLLSSQRPQEYLQRARQRSRPSEALTNIVEEDQGPENRDFNMDDVYLTECLQVLDKDTKSEVEAPEFSEVEEYDFDDFLSIASTTSFTNLVFETNDDITQEVLQAPIPRLPVHESPVISRFPSDRSGVISQNTTTGLPVATGENSRSTKGSSRESQDSDIVVARSGPPVVKTLGEVTPGQEVSDPPISQKNVPRVSPDQEELTVAEESDDMAGRATKTSALRAAENGDFITLQRLTDKYPDQSNEILLARDQRGNTPLHRAALCGQLECLKWLVSHVAEGSLSVRNRDDLTPAAGAAKYGHRECLQWLIEQTSASIELENNNVSLSLLHHAAVSGQEECLRFLLNFMQSKDLPIDIVDHSGVTPSQLAAREGQISCIQTLVEFNADVTIKDKSGRTAADFAYLSGHTSCARYLIAVESCWLLSSRVARLHQELRESKEENQDLKRKIEILEARAMLPDRPDALGAHCQGDGSSSVDSLEGEPENENVFGKISKTSRPLNNVPDGESSNDSSSQVRSGHHHINIDSEIHISGHNAPIKVKPFGLFNGNTDSPTSSGVLTPVSVGDTDVTEIQKVITKQMVAVTHRLMMNRHARNVEERAPLGPGSISRSSSSSSQSLSFRTSDSPVSQERQSPSLETSSSSMQRHANTNRLQPGGQTYDLNVPLREKKTKDFPQQYRWSYAGEKIPSGAQVQNGRDKKNGTGPQSKWTTPIYGDTKKSIHKVPLNKSTKSKSSSSDSSAVSYHVNDVRFRNKSEGSSVFVKCSSSECSCDEDSHNFKYDLTPTHSRSSASSDCSSDLTNDSPLARKKTIPLKPAVTILGNDRIKQSARPPVARKPQVGQKEINSLNRQRESIPLAHEQPLVRQSFPALNNQSQVKNIKKNFEYTQPFTRQPFVGSYPEKGLSSASKQSIRITFDNSPQENISNMNRGSRISNNESHHNHQSYDRLSSLSVNDHVHGSRDHVNGVRSHLQPTPGMSHIEQRQSMPSTLQYIVPLKGNEDEDNGNEKFNEISRDFNHLITDPVNGYSCERLTPPLEASKTSNKASIVRLKAHEYRYVNGTTNRVPYEHHGKLAAVENGLLQDGGEMYGEGDFINQPELSLGLRQSTLAKLESNTLSPPHFDDDYEPSKAWYED